jgi:hypothetical protein
MTLSSREREALGGLVRKLKTDFHAEDVILFRPVLCGGGCVLPVREIRAGRRGLG